MPLDLLECCHLSIESILLAAPIVCTLVLLLSLLLLLLFPLPNNQFGKLECLVVVVSFLVRLLSSNIRAHLFQLFAVFLVSVAQFPCYLLGFLLVFC